MRDIGNRKNIERVSREQSKFFVESSQNINRLVDTPEAKASQTNIVTRLRRRHSIESSQEAKSNAMGDTITPYEVS